MARATNPLDPSGLLGHLRPMAHEFTCRVYYEDTDLAGIVYYANYLKFIERARTEWVRALGVDQARLKHEEDVVFAVHRVEADYLSPALFDDVLTVVTSVVSLTGARIVLSQDVKRAEQTLFSSTVTLIALTGTGKPVRLPESVRTLFEAATG